MQSLIAKYINNTNQNIFLTGRAGTGKTTFLHHLSKHTPKEMVVAAPTGVAAINAGGVTLHSLFQLPFSVFIPDNNAINQGSSIDINTPQSLLRAVKMHRSKRDMIRSLELLVIDEVSMLRADTLDAIDVLLRSIRRNYNVAFGGLQVLFIGDLWQLPPVIRNEEQGVLEPYYTSPYFFNAKVLQDNPPIYIELEKVYRQKEARFIELLNHLRENKLSSSDVQVLNSKCVSNPKQLSESNAVYLTTHNAIANDINTRELNKINHSSFFFEAEINKKFNESQYPNDLCLELKLGAKVMFIKNDVSGKQRYYNGKIGTICAISQDKIEVAFEDGTRAPAELYEWENSRYALNKNTGVLEKIVEGTFVQYPLRLAWAITIHKSQGLTFDKAIIDVAHIFASGQSYVAFSRLRSLDGLILAQPMQQNGINIDEDILKYSTTKTSKEWLEAHFSDLSRHYFLSYIPQNFTFENLLYAIQDYLQSFNKEESRSAKQTYKSKVEEWLRKVEELNDIGLKFKKQLVQIINTNQASYMPHLNERVLKAIAYFEPILQALYTEITDLAKEVRVRKGTKKFLRELEGLSLRLVEKQKKMYKISTLIQSTLEDTNYSQDNVKEVGYIDDSISDKTTQKKAEKTGSKSKEKKQKEDTKLISYTLYKEGLNIAQISEKRDLKATTILGHLTYYVELGELDILDFISQEKINWIEPVILAHPKMGLKGLKTILGDDADYSDIKLVIAKIKKDKANVL